MDFASVKNQIIDSKSNGYGTEITDIVETIEIQQLMDSIELSNHFWNMFVIDVLIGNWDRHNGNWGFYIIRILTKYVWLLFLIVVLVYFPKLMKK